ncbi:hypothetical protein AB4400_22965, partial [Vibrio sp. 10N.261.48.A2]
KGQQPLEISWAHNARQSSFNQVTSAEACGFRDAMKPCVDEFYMPIQIMYSCDKNLCICDLSLIL